MTDYDIHSCGYYCHRPACIEVQRNELRDKLLAKEWVGLTNEELEFYTEELGQGELGRGVLRAVDDFLKEKNA